MANTKRVLVSCYLVSMLTFYAVWINFLNSHRKINEQRWIQSVYSIFSVNSNCQQKTFQVGGENGSFIFVSLQPSDFGTTYTPEENQTRIKELPQKTVVSISPLKIILMWNAWASKMADDPLGKGNCSVKSCLFTTDLSLIQQSDIVVLHFDTLDDYPLERQPHQRFVFYHFESPDNTAATLMNDARFRYNYFNWTMTYRRDSDIFLRDSYGSLINKRSINNNTREARYHYAYSMNNNQSVAEHTETAGYLPGTDETNVSLQLISLIKQKTKMVTWFVGHCDTEVRREEYVRQLSLYVSIDVFGSCTRSCPYHCDEMLRAEYKFYLAFENSWCPDYVTEKFIRPYVYNAVPIVLGGADYTQFAPTNSYINAQDFGSPKELAAYLILLNNSDILYARYFDWKNDYYALVPDMYGWCELCHMAHDSTMPKKVYHDIKEWWMLGAGKCISNSSNIF